MLWPITAIHRSSEIVQMILKMKRVSIKVGKNFLKPLFGPKLLKKISPVCVGKVFKISG